MSNEEQKPPMPNLLRWLFIAVFSILTCCMTWVTARSFTRAAAAERLAKAGQETSLPAYQLDGKYPQAFFMMVVVVVMLITSVSREPGPLVLRRPGRIVIHAIQVGALAFAAVQTLLRTGDHMCATGASYVHSLDWILTCDDSESSLSTPNYAKMMEYSAKEWRWAFFLLAVFYIATIADWQQARSARNKAQELDEKVEVS